MSKARGMSQKRKFKRKVDVNGNLVTRPYSNKKGGPMKDSKQRMDWVNDRK